VKVNISYKTGLIHDIKKPKILAKCIALLSELQESFRNKGFLSDDTITLKTIYGERSLTYSHDDLFEHYNTWKFHFDFPPKLSRLENFPPRKECKRLVMEEIDEELTRLKDLESKQASIEDSRAQAESLSRSVPENSTLDRLFRYETHLNRDFDRTLVQIERLQRMRLGQPVPPPINVNLSKS
jgi:hypothetical protein